MADDPEAALARWVGTALSLQSVQLRKLAGGNSRQIWVVAPDSPTETEARWIVRVQPLPDAGGWYSLAREGRIYAGLNRVRAPVPVLRAARPDGGALVIDLLPGASDIRQLDGAQRGVVVADFLEQLGAVHSASLHAMGLDALIDPTGPRGPIAGCVSAELDRWEAMMRSAPVRVDPLLEFGLGWLRANIPVSSDGPVLVHGDAGPGNFLFVDGQVTGIIDWELAHAGEAMEDLAWVTLRGAFDPVPGLDELIRAHCEKHGIPADNRKLRYYQALALWRVMVIRHRAVGDPDRNLGRNVYYGLMHRRMFVDVMSHNLGIPEPRLDLPPIEPTQRSWLFDACVHHLKNTALPEVHDDASISALSGLIRVLRYLKLWDAGGSWISEQLGPWPEPPSSAHADAADAFEALAKGVIAEHALCAEILGGDSEARLLSFPS